MNTLKELNTNNIKLMIDLFHLQLIKGNITNTLNDLRQYIGHVQVSISALALNKQKKNSKRIEKKEQKKTENHFKTTTKI